MKSILIIGLGRFGSHIARKLNAMGHEVMAVDSNEERINSALDYVTSAQEKFLLRNGADQVVYPEKQLAAWTAIRCSSDTILDYIEVEGAYSIYELSLPQNWVGKTVAQIDIRRKHGINILGVRKNGMLDLNVTPDTLLSPGASILVLGPDDALQKVFRL